MRISDFDLFLFAIVLYVVLRFTDSDYPVGIFRLFSQMIFYLCLDLHLKLTWQIKSYIFIFHDKYFCH